MMTLTDSLRRVIAHQDSLLEAAATRAVQITTPAPHVAFTPPAEAWYSSSVFTTLLGGLLAGGTGIGLFYLTRHRERADQRKQVAQAVGMWFGHHCKGKSISWLRGRVKSAVSRASRSDVR